VTSVTKKPGRVEAGKRLAEWNRQKKLSNQAKQKILSGETLEKQMPIETQKKDTAPPKTNIQSYLIYGITAMGIGYTAYRVWSSKQPARQEPQQEQKPKPQPQPQPLQSKEPDNDPFNMY